MGLLELYVVLVRIAEVVQYIPTVLPGDEIGGYLRDWIVGRFASF